MAEKHSWRFNWGSDEMVMRINELVRLKNRVTLESAMKGQIVNWECNYCNVKTVYRLGHVEDPNTLFFPRFDISLLESSVILHLKEEHWNVFFELLVIGIIRSG